MGRREPGLVAVAGDAGHVAVLRRPAGRILLARCLLCAAHGAIGIRAPGERGRLRHLRALARTRRLRAARLRCTAGRQQASRHGADHDQREQSPHPTARRPGGRRIPGSGSGEAEAFRPASFALVSHLSSFRILARPRPIGVHRCYSQGGIAPSTGSQLLRTGLSPMHTGARFIQWNCSKGAWLFAPDFGKGGRHRRGEVDIGGSHEGIPRALGGGQSVVPELGGPRHSVLPPHHQGDGLEAHHGPAPP